MDIDRRTALQGTTALIASAAIPFPSLAATLAPMSAFQIYDGIGICTHPNWPVYRNFKWQGLLKELDVRHTRGTLGHQNGDLQYFQPMWDMGLKHCSTIVKSAQIDLDKTDAKANIDFLAKLGASKIAGIEGPNEYNMQGSDWATRLRAFMQWLYPTVRSNTALNGVPVVAPSIWKRVLTDYQKLGNIDPYVDRGCLHYYTDRKRPTQSNTTMDVAIVNAHILTPKPIWTTETGYSNHVGPRVKAKYTLRVLLELLRRGVERAYNYELFDSKADPLWGLCDASMNKRPAYYAVKNLLALVKDVPSTPRTLDFQVAGAPADLHSFSVSKSDGSHLIFLLRDVNSTETDLAPVKVTLSFAGSHGFEIFEPTFSNAAKPLPSGATATVPVSDHVAVVRVN